MSMSAFAARASVYAADAIRRACSGGIASSLATIRRTVAVSPAVVAAVVNAVSAWSAARSWLDPKMRLNIGAGWHRRPGSVRAGGQRRITLGRSGSGPSQRDTSSVANRP